MQKGTILNVNTYRIVPFLIWWCRQQSFSLHSLKYDEESSIYATFRLLVMLIPRIQVSGEASQRRTHLPNRVFLYFSSSSLAAG